MANKNGCYNRAPLVESYPVHDGWRDVIIDGAPARVQAIKQVPNRNTLDCQYSRDPKTKDSPACAGCIRHNPDTRAAE